MKTLEVRCCCDATKVLGHLAHPKLQELGDVARFPMLEPTGVRELVLSVSVVQFPFGSQLAVKNQDYPIEDLARIPGFTVNEAG